MWWVLKGYVIGEKPLNLVIEDWKRKLNKKSIVKKFLKLDEKIWKKNQKIIKGIIIRKKLIIGWLTL